MNADDTGILILVGDKGQELAARQLLFGSLIPNVFGANTAAAGVSNPFLGLKGMAKSVVYLPVSYTHLDVYKRQMHNDKLMKMAEEVKKAMKSAQMTESDDDSDDDSDMDEMKMSLTTLTGKEKNSEQLMVLQAYKDSVERVHILNAEIKELKSKLVDEDKAKLVDEAIKGKIKMCIRDRINTLNTGLNG